MKGMSNVVWKHSLEVTRENNLMLTKGAKVISIQMQNKTLCLWEQHDNGEDIKEKRSFVIIGTGQTFGCGDNFELKYLASVQDGQFVWHIFELTRRSK